MSESRLWTRVREGVYAHGHFDRRENNPLDGVPDVNYCVDGCEGHIELKFRRDPPVRDTTPVFGSKGLRESQVAWIGRRLRAGGRVFILSQVGRRLYLTHGARAPEFNALCVEDLEQGSRWAAGPTVSTMQWLELAEALCQPFRQLVR